MKGPMQYSEWNHGRGRIVQVNVALPLDLAERIRKEYLRSVARDSGRVAPTATAIRWAIDQWERAQKGK